MLWPFIVSKGKSLPMWLPHCLVILATLTASPAFADAALLAAQPGTEGSGDGVPGNWNDRWTPEGKRIGLGLQLGFPSAITLEGVVSQHTSVVAGIGAFGYRFFTPAISFYVDYLLHPGILAHPGRDWVLSWYVGIGGWLSVYPNGNRFTGFDYGEASNLALAARVPIGLDLALGRIPIMLYAELVPTLLVFPTIDIGLGASIGIRLFF